MTTLNAIFSNTREKPAESEKLLNLYWNRAELKKEFARLREEQFQLQESVKRQEGVAARMQQKLEHLENLLLDPDWVYSVVTFFQFRRLNLHCTNKLARFAEQLKQQREKKQHSHRLVEWNEDRKREAATVEREIGERRLKLQLLKDQLQAERSHLLSMNSLLRIFRRRSVMSRLDKLATEINATHQQEVELLRQFEEIRHRPPPDVDGLDIRSKRQINFTILAYAQQLYLHFTDGDDLAGMSKEANEKSAGSINYGRKDECEYLLERMQKRLKSFEQSSEFPDVLRRRATLIAGQARFRSDADSVPIAQTVAKLHIIEANGLVQERHANLLGDNYWELSNALSQ